jgi:hypothetical protein
LERGSTQTLYPPPAAGNPNPASTKAAPASPPLPSTGSKP